jgi:hypothetical protein
VGWRTVGDHLPCGVRRLASHPSGHWNEAVALIITPSPAALVSAAITGLAPIPAECLAWYASTRTAAREPDRWRKRGRATQAGTQPKTAQRNISSLPEPDYQNKMERPQRAHGSMIRLHIVTRRTPKGLSTSKADETREKPYPQCRLLMPTSFGNSLPLTAATMDGARPGSPMGSLP